MYEIALAVSACLRAGTQVGVAWAVEAEGLPSIDVSEALAVTPGGGRIGGLLDGALNDELADQFARGVINRVVTLQVGEWAAHTAGLPRAGRARCLLVAAADLPTELWERLREREPVCLLTRVDGDAVVEIALFDSTTMSNAGETAARLFARGASDAVVDADTVVTVLWPVPRLIIVGAGPIVDPLRAVARLLDWRTEVVTEVGMATGLIAGLSALDNVVVTGHDNELAGPVVAAALASPVGYLGVLGSTRRQQSLANWLAYRGITDLTRVHGPAGLDIGATTPPEIAVSIIAEALAVNGKAHQSRRRTSGRPT